MDKNRGRNSSSPADRKTRKRPRLDLENSLSLKSSDRLNETVPEKSDPFEEARHIRMIGAIVDDKTIDEITLRVKEAKVTTEKSIAANHVVLEDNFAMRDMIKALTNRNAELYANFSNLYYEAEKEKSEKAAVEKMRDLQKIQLQEAKADILNSRAHRLALFEAIQQQLAKSEYVDRLEEELEYLKAFFSHTEKCSSSATNDNSSTQKQDCDRVEGLELEVTQANCWESNLEIEGYRLLLSLLIDF